MGKVIKYIHTHSKRLGSQDMRMHDIGYVSAIDHIAAVANDMSYVAGSCTIYQFGHEMRVARPKDYMRPQRTSPEAGCGDEWNAVKTRERQITELRSLTYLQGR